MHRTRRFKMIYYAKILIAIGLVLLAYGLILDVGNTHRLIDPVNDVVKDDNDESIIHVDTNDGSIIKINDSDKNGTSSDSNNNPITGNNNSSDTIPDSNGGSNNPSSSIPNSNGGRNPLPETPQVQPHIPSVDDTNNNLRNQIQSTYGIKVLYGEETNGYRLGDMTTTPIYDATTINSQLNRLNSALSLYPKGLFEEMRKGGIPLTVVLINSYSERGVTGVTDSNYSYATISIAALYPFEDSFYHESYHYIERFLYKYGASYGSSWEVLNPPGSYSGNIDKNLSYETVFSAEAPFVNDYSQTSQEEDRASTFEYMMASSKAGCLNKGTTVWKKAKLISDTIDAVLESVSPFATEYWERYL